MVNTKFATSMGFQHSISLFSVAVCGQIGRETWRARGFDHYRWRWHWRAIVQTPQRRGPAVSRRCASTPPVRHNPDARAKPNTHARESHFQWSFPLHRFVLRTGQRYNIRYAFDHSCCMDSCGRAGFHQPIVPVGRRSGCCRQAIYLGPSCGQSFPQRQRTHSPQENPFAPDPSLHRPIACIPDHRRNPPYHGRPPTGQCIGVAA